MAQLPGWGLLEKPALKKLSAGAQHLQEAQSERGAAASPQKSLLAGSCAQDLREWQEHWKLASPCIPPPWQKRVLGGRGGPQCILERKSSHRAVYTSKQRCTDGKCLGGHILEGAHLAGAALSATPDFVSWAFTLLPLSVKAAELSEVRLASGSEGVERKVKFPFDRAVSMAFPGVMVSGDRNLSSMTVASWVLQQLLIRIDNARPEAKGQGMVGHCRCSPGSESEGALQKHAQHIRASQR